MDIEVLKYLLGLTQEQLYNGLSATLKNFYTSDKLFKKDGFLLAEGDIPIMLVAHLDTVFPTPPTKIYYDAAQATLWSPEGLGTDDRAGVFAILEILQQGYRPHVCFTTDEEIGGLGALQLIDYFAVHPFKELKYIIELDRQGKKDCVFYSCWNEDFIEYVKTFNFQFTHGIFSDISYICPAWKIAGVNLSVGYVNEHTYIEMLNFTDLQNTIKKVINMLRDAKNAPIFKYKQSEKSTCTHCGKELLISDMVKVKGRTKDKYYCQTCAANRRRVHICQKCGSWFEIEHKKDKFCKDCKENK